MCLGILMNIRTRIHSLPLETYNAFRLGFYAFMIIIFQMASAFITQKILKTPYKRTNSPVGPDGTIQSDLINNPFAIPLFLHFSCFLLSLAIYQTDQRAQSDMYTLPWYEPLKIALLDISGSVLNTLATMMTSFIIVSVLMSCQLLMVVLLAVFLSQSIPRFRVQRRQIFIALILCVGVGIYFAYGQQQNDKVNKPLSWLSGLIIIATLAILSYQPEVFAQIRDKYSPPPSVIYYKASKYSFILGLFISACSTYLWKMLVFIWNHDGVILDLVLDGIFRAVVVYFSYKTLLQYKQHMMATISTIRRLLSAIFSALFFHHHLNGIQFAGIGLVFGGILLDIYLSSRQVQADPNTTPNVSTNANEENQKIEPAQNKQQLNIKLWLQK